MDAREMQVEFERIITLMNPAFELKEKLTSDTIFAFLNSAQERYIRNNYLQEDLVADGTRAQKKNADSLKGLIVRSDVVTSVLSNSDRFSARGTLPADYFLYIRSNSYLTRTYKMASTAPDLTAGSEVITPNKTIREDDVEKIISTFYNKAILRNPYVVLNAGEASAEPANENVYLNIIHDSYTKVGKIDLVYYRKPKRFDVIGVDNVNILDTCELPENVHREIVELAVEMFITEAKYRLNMKQPNTRE